MRILRVENSSLVTSVAVVTNDMITAEYTVNFKKTHSQTLLPMIDEVVNMLGIELDSVDAITVSDGSGSFAGLRIDSITAKGLGFAMKRLLIRVPTVDAMAYNLLGSDLLICPIMDARRNQVHMGLYRYREDLEVVKAQCAINMEGLVRELDERGETVVLLGDGVPVYQPLIGEVMKTPYLFAPTHMNHRRVGAMAALGTKCLVEGSVVTAEEFKPNYLRKSRAEQEAVEKELEATEREQEEAGRERGEERWRQRPWKRDVELAQE